MWTGNPTFTYQWFRSALPRGERQDIDDLYLSKITVSIRAPARGATLDRMVLKAIREGFDPRSREGSDAHCVNRGSQDQFRSALPRGERQARWPLTVADARVSIRAPARGATKSSSRSSSASRFRSALPRGGRPALEQVVGEPILFRSALPRGERRSQPVRTRAALAFRSALPRGERRYPRHRRRRPGKFRSALPRGERQGSIRKFQLLYQFRSALPRGERLWGRRRAEPDVEVSIRAPARGATRFLKMLKKPIEVSIRAPARGATVLSFPTTPAQVGFRSALPRGERR